MTGLQTPCVGDRSVGMATAARCPEPTEPTEPTDDGAHGSRHKLLRPAIALAAGLAVVTAAGAGIDDPRLSRAAMVAGGCLVLWLSEAIPLYATTLVLWVGTVLLLGPVDPRAFSTPRVLSAAANPVVALFFGGFALSAAGARYGIDAYIAGWMVRASGGRRRLLLLAVMAGTAVLSMWMSNIAAAAMMVATLRPMLAGEAADAPFRRALLLGVAFAADFGGIGTPIGSGPNLIAIGAVAAHHRITFVDWMRFGLPAAGVMLALAYGLLLALHRVGGRLSAVARPRQALAPRGWCVVAVFFAAVAAWLLEPVHGVPAALVAVAVAAALFGSGLLDRGDLRRVEWDTLLLIAGGLTLGQVLEDSGLARAAAAGVRWDALPPAVLVLCLAFGCAAISAVASNTAAAAMLIQVGLGIAPGSPAIAMLVALGASMGVPFVISTPPNAMAYGQGGLRPRDVLVPGTILMLAGCLLVAVAGPALLRWAGVP